MRLFLKIAAFGVLGFGLIIAFIISSVHFNWFGKLEEVGDIMGEQIPDDVIDERTSIQSASATEVGITDPKQIVFGDLHVHTTYSTDAFIWALPLLGGDGAYPIADACDYARYCSAIDFWAITDHAEASTPRKWEQTKKGIRQCNAIAGNKSDPDLVSYIGFEWTQVGRLPDQHYGHKNVIFENEDDASVSARAIAAGGPAFGALRSSDILPSSTAYLDWSNRDNYFDFQAFMNEVQETPLCPSSVPSNELPDNCVEYAQTPGELVERLESQGLDYLLIPHGTSWGYYTPQGTTLDKQLISEMRPETQELIEIYSGHGNSEEHRSWRSVNWEQTNEGLSASCPQPTDDYIPPCWRAGEIIESRCLESGEQPAVCTTLAEETRYDTAQMSVAYHLAIKGEGSEEWLDSGQCTDCFLPAFQHRPGTSVQYGLAISNFDNGDDNPTRFDWGFIASSDNHRARPGTGYKEFDRRRTTESGGAITQDFAERMLPPEDPIAVSKPIPRQQLNQMTGFGLTEVERQASFWLTGGLAAVHTNGRSRHEIWDAMKRRETYATSGPRILLWFDKTDQNEPVPMGGRAETNTAPEFTVHAIGSFKQKLGCPDHSANGLNADRLQNLCAGECYNPSDERHLITRIEVIRIQPQSFEGELVDDLIEDPWRTFECPLSEAGCTITFEDPDYVIEARDTTYYVRAIQEETLAINADPLRCERDENGRCVEVNLCRGDWRSDWNDECLDPVEERAWSSPIYLTWGEE